MSRKNYRAVAAVLSAAFTTWGDAFALGDEYPEAALNQVLDGLVAVFRADNPRFDEKRFRAAVNERTAEQRPTLVTDEELDETA